MPAVVFSMGAPPLDLDEPRLVRIAEDSARKGVVMLVPFSERLDEERIEPEEIDALVAEFQYVQSAAAGRLRTASASSAPASADRWRSSRPAIRASPTTSTTSCRSAATTTR